jgi:filamentous hemagglutinin family protein
MVLVAPKAIAQITTDGSLPNNSIININGNIFNITGGTQAGGNLFHSFKDFSVPTGSGAFFNNTVDIQNIISRVTGGSVSNIDGLIRTLGTANLFLINPNGIIFGQNARLNIGGSFLASTASSLKFADSFEFSATVPQATPLLTVSVPTGLQYGQNPQRILVQGNGQGQRIDTPFGLRVQPNQTLALVGGDVVLEGGTLKTAGGRIELGSVDGSSLGQSEPTNKGWALDYAGVTGFKDIQLSQQAAVDASGEGGGDIQVRGRQLKLNNGSRIEANTVGSQPGGNLTVKTSESVELIGTSENIFSGLFNSVLPGATGGGGTLAVETGRLIVRDGAKIEAAGDITVTAKSMQLGNQGTVTATTRSGNGGDITLNLGDLLLLRANSQISSNAGTAEASGNGGNITINAPDGFILAVPNENSDITANAFSGRGGVITINSLANLNIQQRSRKDLVRQLGTEPNQLNPQNLPTNDITAFSQTRPTLNGQVIINSFVVYPKRAELPIVLADTTKITDTSCAAFGEGEGNSFTITRRGGLPPSPYEPISTDVIWLDNRIPNIATQQRSEKPTPKPSSKEKTVEIVPATGWVFDGKGNVTLISHASNANKLGSTPACQKR